MKKLLMSGIAVAVTATCIFALTISGMWPGSLAKTYAATPSAPSVWVTGIQVMNQGTDTAHVTIDFYDQSGAKVTSIVGATIPVGGSASYYSPTQIPGLPNGFVGSAVVSSDQPVAAILNTSTPTETGVDPSSPLRIGSATGVASPSTTLYFPQVERQYYNYNSVMYIQNTSGSSATVNVEYVGVDGTTKTTTSRNVPAYSTVVVRQQDETALGQQWVGSAVVTSSALLAGMASIFNDNSSSDKSQVFSYNPFSTGSSKLYLAKVVKNYYGFNSGITVQNIGASPTTVTIGYYMNNDPVVRQHSKLLGPKQPWVVYLGNPAAIPSGLPDTFGAAIVTSDGQPIVANVNEEFRGDASSSYAGYGYTVGAFLDGQQTNTVLLPKVSSKFYGYASGFQIQNVGSVATNMTASLVERGSGGRTYTLNTSSPIEPGKAWAVFLPDKLPADWLNFDGSATITANQPIVGMATQTYRFDKDSRYGVKYGDSNTGYNGINK